MPSACSEQDPLISADLESPVLFRDRQRPGLNNDELVDGKDAVGVSPHESRSMHASLHHRRREAATRFRHEDGIVPIDVGTGPRLR
jgi:hypothetical protein